VQNSTWQRCLTLAFFSKKLAGGTSSMQQLKERLEKELMEVPVCTFYKL
jgi:hypothetical protein